MGEGFFLSLKSDPFPPFELHCHWFLLCMSPQFFIWDEVRLQDLHSSFERYLYISVCKSPLLLFVTFHVMQKKQKRRHLKILNFVALDISLAFHALIKSNKSWIFPLHPNLHLHLLTALLVTLPQNDNVSSSSSNADNSSSCIKEWLIKYVTRKEGISHSLTI